MSTPNCKLIIGIIGVHQAANTVTTKRAGKDFFCQILIEELREKYGVQAKRVAFADPLYQEVADAFGVPVSFIVEHKEIFRRLLQEWGTEIRRNLFGDDYWIKKAKVIIDECQEPVVVITDCRRWNEVQFIRQSGGIIVKVFRVSLEGLGIGNSAHESERFATENVPVDHTIFNTGGIPELVARTQEFLALLHSGASKLPVFNQPPPRHLAPATDGEHVCAKNQTE